MDKNLFIYFERYISHSSINNICICYKKLNFEVRGAPPPHSRSCRGNCVKDRFCDSLSALKNPPSTPSHGNYDLDYKLILWLSSSQPIPLISIQTTEKILHSLKKHVHDIQNISPLHYINAGHAGIKVFHTLLTSLILFINLSTLESLNQVLSILLHKGHGKDLCSNRSYRTISNCTVLAKALDAYIGSLNIPG